MKSPILSADKWERAFAHVAHMDRPSHYKLLLLLVQQLGLRPKELAGLQVSWFNEGELRIPKGHSKGSACRSLPVSRDIILALYEHCQGTNRAHVFVNQLGNAFTAGGMSASVARLFKECGIKGSAYSGRRGLATRLVDEGVSIAVVQQVLGHRHLSTTQEYISCTPSMIRRAMYG